MTGLTAGSHLLASERGRGKRRAQCGPGHGDGPAQVTEGRERRGRRSGLLPLLSWAKGEE
jgi:hypothetical protein